MPDSVKRPRDGPRPSVEASAAITAEMRSRNPKRKKLRHGPLPGGFHARSRSRGKTPTAAVRKKHVRPQPPRELRSSGIKHRQANGKGTGADVKTNIRHSARPLTSDSEGNITTLSFAKSLLGKIWVRNKNQHRTQPWWRTLSSLRKATSRLTALEDEERRLKSETQLAGSHTSGQHARKRFERESQLRTEEEAWMQWIREVLLPKAYLGFSSLVGDTQFANLGVVLVGVLADIVSVTGAPEPVKGRGDGPGDAKMTETQRLQEMVATGEARRLEATSLRVTGLQSGELVERQYDSDDLGEIVERDTSEGDAKKRQILRSNENKKVTNTPSDRGDLRRPSPAAVIPKMLKQENLATQKIEAASARRQPDVGRTMLPNETFPRGKSESATNGAGKVGKPKQGKPRKKNKNAIDDLFAGLT